MYINIYNEFLLHFTSGKVRLNPKLYGGAIKVVIVVIGIFV